MSAVQTWRRHVRRICAERRVPGSRRSRGTDGAGPGPSVGVDAARTPMQADHSLMYGRLPDCRDRCWCDGAGGFRFQADHLSAVTGLRRPWIAGSRIEPPGGTRASAMKRRYFLGSLAAAPAALPLANQARGAVRAGEVQDREAVRELLIQEGPVAGFQYHDGESVWFCLSIREGWRCRHGQGARRSAVDPFSSSRDISPR